MKIVKLLVILLVLFSCKNVASSDVDQQNQINLILKVFKNFSVDKNNLMIWSLDNQSEILNELASQRNSEGLDLSIVTDSEKLQAIFFQTIVIIASAKNIVSEE